MFKRSMMFVVFAAALFSLGATTGFAQYASISGVVMVEKDGGAVPAEGVLVEVFRTDISQGGPKDKTDKGGRFAFAGVQLGGTYVLAFSGPGMSPSYIPGVKPGAENLKITLKAGDGRQLTPAEIRTLAAGGGGSGQMSDDEKKKVAEQEAKIKEIEASNKKIEEANAIVTRSLAEGNAAFQAKDYDTAIVKYEEGYNAMPDFMGSAPIMLNNKGIALRVRAVNNYNAAIKVADPKAREEAKSKVRSEFSAALEAHVKALKMLKTPPPANVTAEVVKAQTTTALEQGYAVLKVIAQTEQVDPANMENTKFLLDEVVAVEADPVKKAAVKIVLGDLFRVSQDSDNAILVYKEVLAGDPNNVDAMAGAGLSLVNAGYNSGNKAQLQEGADLLQKYSETAPADHKYINDAKGLIEVLKAEQNINPTKGSGTRTTRRRN